MNVIGLDTQLLHGLWSQEGTDLGDDRSTEALKDNCVMDLENTIEQHNIDGGTKTLDDLDLQYCTFEMRLLVQLFGYARLTLPR